MNDNRVMAVMIVVAMLLIVVIAVVKIRRRMRRFLNSAEVCLVRELVRSAQNGELQQEEQPKSLGGMTSIYLPQILRDFPEFNWEELRAEVEQSVKELLETKNVRSAGAVRIHKTVISRYQKYNGTASILCETAAEYWSQAENGHVCGGRRRHVMCAKAQRVSMGRTTRRSRRVKNRRSVRQN